MGALFPSNETDDPETISTSMPGLFFTALSLIYGALCSFILYTTMRTTLLDPLLLCILITAGTVILMLIQVPKLRARYNTAL
jgi:hypothetical protein